ncbi:protein TMEPAI-like [Corythoichthys intestinalis]|uniref:protein TMEPAI-like n=1 Tax=Corythoichthys intestinalis TaxID=161448 RepID=UPI0025A60573|nr:protein TMEPAI-like [Corythoichthys intestinalis]XP_061808581.1 protein TMEPAI-like [Nerophis lumbriciformis]
MRRLRAACNDGGGVGSSLHRRPGGRLMRNPAAHLRSSSPTQSNGYCSCTGPQPQGMDISELELVQIILILLAMSVMVAVIICLLIHYRLVALSLLGRLGHAQEVPTAPRDSSGWPSAVLTQHGQGQSIHGLPNRTTPVFVQHRQLCRLQPTYPYMPQDTVGLPPMIRLPDGEEKEPRFYLQHTELKRSCIRAPPNRTVLIDNYVPSTATWMGKRESGSSGESSESPPPSYSVTIEDSCCKIAAPGPKRVLQTSWCAAENTTSTEAVPHNSSVT